MKQKYDTQTLFILREFKKALEIGAEVHANKISLANPEIPMDTFQAVARGEVEVC